MLVNFKDRIAYDASTKSIVSCRDGVQEYYGHELGINPANKLFTVFRSANTIRNITKLMDGLPITDDHIEFDDNISKDLIIGSIIDTKVVKNIIDKTDTTINLTHKADIVEKLISDNSKELSLGYQSGMIEHDKYDFEQTDIVPHHLAVVSAGRCGDVCKINDRKGETMDVKEFRKFFIDAVKTKDLPNFFLDEEGESVNMETVVEIVPKLSEAIKKLDVDKLKGIMPMLNEIIALAKENDETEETELSEDAKAEKEEKEKKEKEDAKADKEEKEKMEKENTDLKAELAKFSDAEKFTDSKEFKDALETGIIERTTQKMKDYSEVREKAVDFVDSNYDFSGKTPCEIMKDSVVAHMGEGHGIEDADISTAFKVMKKISDYKNFGDSATDLWNKTKDKEY